MVFMRDLIARSRVLPLLISLIALSIIAGVTKQNMDALSIETAEAQEPVSANANPLLAN